MQGGPDVKQPGHFDQSLPSDEPREEILGGLLTGILKFCIIDSLVNFVLSTFLDAAFEDTVAPGRIHAARDRQNENFIL